MGDASNNSTVFKIGPAGSEYGYDQWDEKGRTKIVQIFVHHQGFDIISIQFMYAENGALVLSKKHGSSGTDTLKFDAVKLNYPDEYITRIFGYKNPHQGLHYRA